MMEQNINYLEDQNLNLKLMHNEVEELKKQNNRLHKRLMENKNKS